MKLSNIPFRIESSLAKAGMRALGVRPTSHPFISGDSFRALSDLVFEHGSLKRVKPHDQSGCFDLIFVDSSKLLDFLKNARTLIDRPYVLISNNGDENITEKHLEKLDSRVLHMFAHNLLVKDERATCIPIGLENARLHWNGVVSDFISLRKGLDKLGKAPQILSSFTVGNNRTERNAAVTALRASRVAAEFDRTHSRAYRQRLARFMFVAAPPGNGFDCHRTWEALYLNVVPVVKRHPFFEQFPGLPLLQVDDWNDLLSYSESQLAKVYHSLKGRFSDLPILWMDYWKNQILRKAGKLK